MKRLVMCALVLAACGEEPGEMYPIQPGGGGGAGGSSRTDAAVDASGDDGPISGRVCLIVANLRSVSSNACAATGAGELTVALGAETAMTTADGSFTIARPATTELYWAVTGGGIEGSLVKFGATFGTGTAPLLPAFGTVAYEQMAFNNSITLGVTGMIVRVTKAGAPVTGATVDTDPDAQIFYDGDTDDTWLDESTGAFGVAWIPAIGGSLAQLAITVNDRQTTFADVQLNANALTFVVAEIP
jgi:hypothetical protein